MINSERVNRIKEAISKSKLPKHLFLAKLKEYIQKKRSGSILSKTLSERFATVDELETRGKKLNNLYTLAIRQRNRLEKKAREKGKTYTQSENRKKRNEMITFLLKKNMDLRKRDS
jgi:hypothetical protein